MLIQMCTSLNLIQSIERIFRILDSIWSSVDWRVLGCISEVVCGAPVVIFFTFSIMVRLKMQGLLGLWALRDKNFF